MATLAEFLDSGLSHFKARRYPEAMACFGAALKADPSMPQVWSLLGVCFSEAGNKDQALQCFDEAVKLAPQTAVLWSNRANALNRLGRHEDALESAGKALELDAESADSWNNKGVALQCLGTRDRQLGRLQEALRCFNQALRLAPAHAGALANKARAVEQIRNVDQLASAPEPTTAEEWVRRGDALGGAEQLRCFQRAVEADPVHAPAWLRKSIFELDAGRHRAALVSTKRFLEVAGPEFAKEIGQARQALEALSLEGVPEGEPPPGLTDEAIAEASRLVNDAIALNGARNFPKAANAAERALAANPACASAWFHKAYALDELGHDSDAVLAYEEALKLRPDYAMAWQNKAALLCELKRFEESLACWDRVIALRPGEGRWLDQKAKALASLGRVDEAAELTMKALEDPAFADAYEREKQALGEMMGIPRVQLSKEEQDAALEALASGDMSAMPTGIRELAARLERQGQAQDQDHPEGREALAWSEKARKYLAERTPEGARKALAAAEEALKLVAEYPPALFVKGSALWALDRACESARVIVRFKEVAWANMGKQLGAADDILEMLRGAGAPAEPADAQTDKLIDRAYALYHHGIVAAGTPQDKLALADKVLAVHQGHPKAWFSKGRALEELGRLEEAVRCLLEAGRLLPDFTKAWVLAARLQFQLGRVEDALATVTGGLPHAPQHVDVVALKGLRVTALLALGREAEGLAELDALLADPKIDPELRTQLAGARSGLRAGPEARATAVKGGGQAVAASAAARDGAPAAAEEGDAARHRKGEVIGNKYEVCGLLGMGGFGIVYQVYARETRMVYALKTFREEYLADPGTRDMFKREAQLWLDLGSHPYLVRAHFVDELHGRLYIAMEFLPGGGETPNTVEGWLKKGPIPLEQATRWAVQFCHGMEYAARRGVRCHRDIKPANILVAPDGSIRVSDFGLAAALSLAKVGNRLGLRGTGEVGLSCAAEGGAGTPPYMPPEQFSASGRCDERSDVYAFGVTLYQMVSGRLPLMPPRPADGAEARGFWDAMRKLAAEAPPPPLKHPLWPLISRCLKKDPAHRFQSFGEMRESLEEMLLEWTGETIPAPEPGKLTAADWNNRGASLNDLDRFEDAVACFDRALELEPNQPRLLANKALALRGLGRAEEALAAADLAASVGRSEPAAWNHRGLALMDLGRLDDAAAAFERAAELKPDLFDAWLNLAGLHQTRGRHEAALACCERVLAMDPKAPGAWTSKGVSLDLLGRVEEALACYRKAVELDPNQFMAWMNLGIIRRRQSQPADALAAYQKACEIDPGRPSLWFNVGVAEEELGRPDTARRAYERFLSLSPGPELESQIETARRKLAELAPAPQARRPEPEGPASERAELLYNQAVDLLRKGEATAALERLNLCVQSEPRYEKAWASRATALSLLGQDAEALVSIDKAIALKPGDASNWAAKGAFLFKLERHDEALSALDEALRLDPNDGLAWGHRGAIFRASGKREEAAAAFAKSLELMPQQPDVWHAKALLEAELGRKEAAIASLQEFLRRAPANDIRSIDRAREKLRQLESGGAPVTDEQVKAWLEKATILANQGKFDLAREPLARVLEARPGDAKAWEDYARCLLELGRLEEGLRAAETAIEKTPRNAQGWLLKAQCLNRLKRDEEAVPAYDEALRREGRLVKALLGKGQSLYLVGYRKQLGRALESGGSSNGVLSMGELSAEARGFLERALAALDQALAVEPLSFDAKYHKGTVHLALGQKEEGAKAYRQFLSTAPMTLKETMDEVRLRLKELGAL